jgi:hypothetical protein
MKRHVEEGGTHLAKGRAAAHGPSRLTMGPMGQPPHSYVGSPPP